MKRHLSLLVVPVLCTASVAWMPAPGGPTDPKALTLQLSDMPSGFAITAAKYGNLKQSPANVRRHGLVKSYEREFQKKRGLAGMIVSISDVASFRSAGGASWSLTYLEKQVKPNLSSLHTSRFNAPKFGQQSAAFAIQGRASGSDFVGAVFAMRVNRYDSVVLTLGLKSSYSASAGYSLARRAASRLSSGA